MAGCMRTFARGMMERKETVGGERPWRHEIGGITYKRIQGYTREVWRSVRPTGNAKSTARQSARVNVIFEIQRSTHRNWNGQQENVEP